MALKRSANLRVAISASAALISSSERNLCGSDSSGSLVVFRWSDDGEVLVRLSATECQGGGVWEFVPEGRCLPDINPDTKAATARSVAERMERFRDIDAAR